MISINSQRYEYLKKYILKSMDTILYANYIHLKNVM